MSDDRFDPTVAVPLGEAPPGHYHPEPTIDAEVRADAREAREANDAAGIREGWHRAQPPAHGTPRPWTEAHSEQAVMRLLEISGSDPRCMFIDRASRIPGWANFILHGLKSVGHEGKVLVAPGEEALREILDAGYFGFDADRINREVAIVRERAEQPCLVCHEVGFHKMSCYPQNREDARRRREEAADGERRPSEQQPHPIGRTDTLALIRAQKAGALRADELAALMTRLEWIFASEDAPPEQCPRCGGLRGVVCGACAGAGCEACGGDGDLPCPTCNPRGDAGMATPDGMHPVARAHQEVIRERDAIECEADDLRAQLAAAKELLRATEPVMAAAEALADLWEARRDGRLAAVSTLVEAVKAARDNRVEDPKPRVVPCVAALVTDPAGRLLLVHTKRGWELPGGRMEPGETWRSAIARELREETGLDVVLDAGEPRVFDGMPVNGAQYQSIIVIARGRAEGDAAPAVGDAVREARWFAAAEVALGGLSNIATAAIVREWVEAQPEPCLPCNATGSTFAGDGPTTCGGCNGTGNAPIHIVDPAPAWTPPPGVAVEVLHGSVDGPLLIALVTIDPGAAWPLEVHQEQEERVVLHAGRVIVEHGPHGARHGYLLDSGGMTALVPRGAEHVVRNASATEPATYLAVLRRVSSADAEPATVRREEEP